MAKVKKEKVIKIRKVIEKPYNSGTMTTSGFFSWIRSFLRQKSRFWIPIQDAKKAGRRLNKSSNKKLKFEYQCAECKNWFPEKEISIDHKQECGQLKSFEDLPGFMERLFVEADSLQILCKMGCHLRKTNEYRKSLKIIENNEE